MRSRYAAFATGNHRYIADTWHPDTRPPGLMAELANAPRPMRWLELEIAEAPPPQANLGEVSFRARWLQGDQLGELRERSRFERLDGRWYYRDGDAEFRPLARIGRNDPCPCGSGRKFKRCCQASGN